MRTGVARGCKRALTSGSERRAAYVVDQLDKGLDGVRAAVVAAAAVLQLEIHVHVVDCGEVVPIRLLHLWGGGSAAAAAAR